MLFEETIHFYDRQIIIKNENPQLSDEINQLINFLAKINNSSKVGQSHLPVYCLISPKKTFSVPPDSRLLSYKNSVLKIFSWKDVFYFSYRDCVLKADPKKGTLHGFFDSSVLNIPRLFTHGFMLTALVLLLHSRGLYYLHSAALEFDNQGYLIVAKSGSGKSTNTLSLIENGWNYLSDDAILLHENENSTIEAGAIPNEFKLNVDLLNCDTRKDLYEHSFDASELDNGFYFLNNDERFVPVDKVHSQQYRTRCIPRFIIQPEISPQSQSRMVPLKKREALDLLMRESPFFLFQLNAAKEHLEFLKNLVNQCRSYRLLAGQDILKNSTKLVDILNQNVHILN